MSFGPTHTRGNTIVRVDSDRVLCAGDVVMNRGVIATAAYTEAP